MSSSRARRVLITGAASGIGLEAALQLAACGDHVIVADRNAAGGTGTVKRIEQGGGSAEFRVLDLGDMSSIRALAAAEVVQELPLDVLINNAGLLPPMTRTTTRDGFELEFGVSHLGHFALTALLMPSLLRSSQPRVVSVSSLAHRHRHIDFDDLQFERNYSSSRVYGTTKLACLMFAVELQRRAAAAQATLVSVAAHPGISATPIAAGWKGEKRRKLRDRFEVWGYNAAIYLFGNTAAQGAQSLVYAASSPDVVGGAYYGPTGFNQMGGSPGRVQPARQALDEAVAARLWEASERLTNVRYEALATLRTMQGDVHRGSNS